MSITKELYWFYWSARTERFSDITLKMEKAAELLMLEAASMDLGTVWISYFDQEKVRHWMELPETWEPVCILYFGYPAADFVPHAKLGCHRKPIKETCFYNAVPRR